MAIITGITIEEFERLPYALAHNRELVNGELVDVSGNTPAHNRLRDYLVRLIVPPVEDRGLGIIISEQEFQFGDNAHGPDVAMIGADKLPLLDRKRRVQLFVPDLAIEIVSQRDTFTSLVEKAERYRKCGVKEVWILDQDNRKAFVLSGERQAILNEDDAFESKLIPGFSVLLKALFDHQ